MRIIDTFTGPAGSGKTTKLRRVAAAARNNGQTALEIVASEIYKSELERLIREVKPDVLLLDEWSPACGWRPEDLVGPDTVQVYYAA
jgi:nucleoside-triphosphatase THEP1